MAAASSGFWHMPDAWTNLANVYLAQVGVAGSSFSPPARRTTAIA